jgi:hypothetical protein
MQIHAPEAVDMSSERLTRLSNHLAQLTTDNQHPGNMTLIQRKGDDGTTRVTKSQTVQPVGFGRILGPLLKRALGKQVGDEADLIKQHLEK